MLAQKTRQSQPTPLPDSLPNALIQRLRANGIDTCEGWQALGRKRFKIFGITRAHVARLDTAVAVALERGQVLA